MNFKKEVQEYRDKVAADKGKESQEKMQRRAEIAGSLVTGIAYLLIAAFVVTVYLLLSELGKGIADISVVLENLT